MSRAPEPRQSSRRSTSAMKPRSSRWILEACWCDSSTASIRSTSPYVSVGDTATSLGHGGGDLNVIEHMFDSQALALFPSLESCCRCERHRGIERRGLPLFRPSCVCRFVDPHLKSGRHWQVAREEPEALYSSGSVGWAVSSDVRRSTSSSSASAVCSRAPSTSWPHV